MSAPRRTSVKQVVYKVSLKFSVPLQTPSLAHARVAKPRLTITAASERTRHTRTFMTHTSCPQSARRARADREADPLSRRHHEGGADPGQGAVPNPGLAERRQQCLGRLAQVLD